MKSKEIAFKILKELKEKNIDAYLVGGSSREYLLNKEFIDIDICSKGTPDINLLALSNYELISKEGKFYGVLKYIIEDYEIEITTLRKEGPYIKKRRPSYVEFIDNLEIDSLRRDFTINAIYIDYLGNIYDYHNGLNDLNNKVIRMIGDPWLRIEEDALRILRAIRLSEKLNFSIEDNLKNIIKEKHESIYSLNKNTLKKELDKFLEFKSKEEIEDILKEYQIEMGKIYEY